MANISLNIGTVREIETTSSKDGYDGLRVRAQLVQDDPINYHNIPWAFPLLPKTFQSIPKVGEAVFVLVDDDGDKTTSQRYFIGPIISQPQYNDYCQKENATTLLKTHERNPLGKISNYGMTQGAFPTVEDVAVVGRGSEDVILRYDKEAQSSEVLLRAGVRTEPTNSRNQDLIGKIIFNGTDPAYIQLKYEQGLSTGELTGGNSVINLVANRINIMSNSDDDVSDKLQNSQTMVSTSETDEMMDSLHQVPKGDKLVELLKIIKGCIMHHVHPWAGMEQCGDWPGFINKLEEYDIDSILSEYVRIS